MKICNKGFKNINLVLSGEEAAGEEEDYGGLIGRLEEIEGNVLRKQTELDRAVSFKPVTMEDSLEEYMANIGRGDSRTRVRLKADIINLKSEHRRVVGMANGLRPLGVELIVHGERMRELEERRLREMEERRLREMEKEKNGGKMEEKKERVKDKEESDGGEKKLEGKKREVLEQRRVKRAAMEEALVGEYPDYVEDPDYDMWVPPVDGKGDVNLNDKFGY